MHSFFFIICIFPEFLLDPLYCISRITVAGPGTMSQRLSHMQLILGVSVQVPDTLLPTQAPANAAGKPWTPAQVLRGTEVPVNHTVDSDWGPGAWLPNGPALAIVGIWWVNQWSEDLSLFCPSLFLSSFLPLCVCVSLCFSKEKKRKKEIIMTYKTGCHLRSFFCH